MGIAPSESLSEGPASVPRTLTALLLESMIALPPSNRRARAKPNSSPVFSRLWDRLFWILFLAPVAQWRDCLIIVQPETVLHWQPWCWSNWLWRYRARGRWRGGRPRVSSEIRHLIAQMARENFLWGAPRIHGELLMLGFNVSQATISRYMPARSRRPGQSWRTFLRNQAMAFGHCACYEEWSRGDAGLQSQSYSARFERSGAAQIATVWVGLKSGFSRAQPTLSNRRICLHALSSIAE